MVFNLISSSDSLNLAGYHRLMIGIEQAPPVYFLSPCFVTSFFAFFCFNTIPLYIGSSALGFLLQRPALRGLSPSNSLTGYKPRILGGRAVERGQQISLQSSQFKIGILGTFTPGAFVRKRMLLATPEVLRKRDEAGIAISLRTSTPRPKSGPSGLH